MKTILNAKLTRKLNIDAISIFPFIFVKEGTISPYLKEMIKTYKNQAADLTGIGIAIAIVTLFILFAFNIVTWKLSLLVLIPLLIQPVWLMIEGIIKQDVNEISFVKQAIDFGKEWNLPCQQKTVYSSFSWFKYI